MTLALFTSLLGARVPSQGVEYTFTSTAALLHGIPIRDCVKYIQIPLLTLIISVLKYRGDVGKKHAKYSGFLQVAEKNGIIIVFPQVKKTKENPNTCWDIYGYTGPNYGIVSQLTINIKIGVRARMYMNFYIL
jgi:hypothetical protein